MRLTLLAAALAAAATLITTATWYEIKRRRLAVDQIYRCGWHDGRAYATGESLAEAG